MTFKYCKFTMVDHITKIPLSEGDSKNGPEFPPLVTPTFEISSNTPVRFPTFYGIIPSDSPDLSSFSVEVVSESEFYGEFRVEMIRRVMSVSDICEDDRVSTLSLIKNLKPDENMAGMLEVVKEVYRILEESVTCS